MTFVVKLSGRRIKLQNCIDIALDICPEARYPYRNLIICVTIVIHTDADWGDTVKNALQRFWSLITDRAIADSRHSQHIVATGILVITRPVIHANDREQYGIFNTTRPGSASDGLLPRPIYIPFLMRIITDESTQIVHHELFHQKIFLQRLISQSNYWQLTPRRLLRL